MGIRLAFKRGTQYTFAGAFIGAAAGFSGSVAMGSNDDMKDVMTATVAGAIIGALSLAVPGFCSNDTAHQHPSSQPVEPPNGPH